MTTVEFQAEFISNAAMPVDDSAADIMRDFVAKRGSAISQGRELGVRDDGMQDIKRKFASALVRRWMMLRFPAIDLSFTERKWWLVVERSSSREASVILASDAKPDVEPDRVTRMVAECPRFFTAEVNAKDFALKGKPVEASSEAIGTLPHGRRGADNFSSMDVRVSAKIPDGLTGKHTVAARLALSHYYLAVALCLSHGIDLRDDLNEDRYSRNNPKLKLIWAPNQDALSVTLDAPRPLGDPAVIIEIADHNFLLDFYDTPDEENISHLIREFSEGKL